MKNITQKIIKWLSLALVLSALQFTNTFAYETAQPQSSAPQTLKVTTEVEPVKVSEEIKIPVAEFDADKATQAYLDRLSADAREKSDSYYEGGYWLQLWNFLLTIVIAYFLLQSGLSVKMRDFSQKITRFVFVQNMIYVVQYIILVSVISFPLAVYQGYFREHAYGLSNLSFAGWLGEEFKGLIISLLLMSLAVAGIYKVVHKARKTWAVWGAVLSIVFIAFVAMIGPVYISPLFNDYVPLKESELKSEILSMARANGVPAENVYEFNASKQSKRISANVSGMFGTLRVSLNDNLMNRSSPESVKAVMGHELGHYVLNHGIKFLLSFGIVMVLAFVFLKWGFHRFNRPSWGIKGEDDIAGFPLAMALFSVYFFLMTPVTNTIVRSSETEADYFGLNASNEPDGFADAIFSLSEYRKMKPGYWEEIIFYDHPSGYNRIHAAMVWKREQLWKRELLKKETIHGSSFIANKQQP